MAKETTEIVQNVSDYVNTFSVNSRIKEFCEQMDKEHRTLQQNFTRLCLSWIHYISKDDYRFDLRNQDSHERAKLIIDLFKKHLAKDHNMSDATLEEFSNPAKWLRTI